MKTGRLASRKAADLVAGVSAVILVACIGVGLWLHWHPAGRGDETARGEVLGVAKADVADVLSYNYTALDQYRSRAQTLTVGDFQTQLAALIAGRLGKAARQDKIVTQATVPEVGVVSSASDEVVVLAFVNQVTTKRSLGIPLVQGSRVRVTFQRSGGGWKISKLDPV